MMGMSAESMVIAVSDGARRRRLVSRINACGVAGYAEGAHGEALPDAGYVVMVSRSRIAVAVADFVAHGVAVMREFERANAGRLDDDGRYVVAFVDAGYVHLGVGVAYADRGMARFAAREEGEAMMFDCGREQQVWA